MLDSLLSDLADDEAGPPDELPGHLAGLAAEAELQAALAELERLEAAASAAEQAGAGGTPELGASFGEQGSMCGP
jgi:hypothetical protein